MQENMKDAFEYADKEVERQSAHSVEKAKPEDWRERFDREFPNLYYGYTDSVNHHFCSINMKEKVKIFISAEISAAVEAERGKIFSELREGYDKFEDWNKK